MGDFLLKNGQTILFIGNSITDCGRRDQFAPLGNGYVKLFDEIVMALQPKLRLKIINTGISGNKVDELRARWHDDVMRYDLDWLSVKIGINDIHRQLGTPDGPFSVEQFAADYEAILAQTARGKKKARFILIDPFYISTDLSGMGFRTSVLTLLDEYLAVVEGLAKKHNAIHLKTHAMFQRMLKHHPPDDFCPEPVHPYRSGHLAIALELYRLLGGTL
jgi:lysophospholipase L1-like esterase